MDITWGQIADIADMNLESYRQLEPPPELEEFHRIRLETLEAFRDNARSRGSSGFVMVDLQEMLMAVFPQLMEMGVEPNKTDEEKEAVAQELILQELGKVYGEKFAAGLAAEDQVTSRLPSSKVNVERAPSPRRSILVARESAPERWKVLVIADAPPFTKERFCTTSPRFIVPSASRSSAVS